MEARAAAKTRNSSCEEDAKNQRVEECDRRAVSREWVDQVQPLVAVRVERVKAEPVLESQVAVGKDPEGKNSKRPE